MFSFSPSLYNAFEIPGLHNRTIVLLTQHSVRSDKFITAVISKKGSERLNQGIIAISDSFEEATIIHNEWKEQFTISIPIAVEDIRTGELIILADLDKFL